MVSSSFFVLPFKNGKHWKQDGGVL